MPNKFYGVWFPAGSEHPGWFRILRSDDHKPVVWSSTEHRFAQDKARELGGVVKRTDLALSEPSAEEQMLKAELSAKGKGKLWQRITKIIRRFHPATLTSS